jgi:hypothetical protein
MRWPDTLPNRVEEKWFLSPVWRRLVLYIKFVVLRILWTLLLEGHNPRPTCDA